jgi:transposase-like protein
LGPPHEGEVLEAFATKKQDRKAALIKAMKRYGRPGAIVTDGCRSYRVTLKRLAARQARRLAAGLTIGLKNHTSRSGDENGRWRNQEREVAAEIRRDPFIRSQ